MDMALKIIDEIIDVEFINGDYSADEGLETAVLISLFTDARATEAEAGEDSRRGWWGDLYPDAEGDHIGSKLWLYDRSKTNQENLVKIQSDIAACLQWLVDDKIASSVEVVASLVDSFSISLEVAIARPSGKSKYDYIWNNQRLKRA